MTVSAIARDQPMRLPIEEVAQLVHLPLATPTMQASWSM
jgi:hypothetical protein